MDRPSSSISRILFGNRSQIATDSKGDPFTTPAPKISPREARARRKKRRAQSERYRAVHINPASGLKTGKWIDPRCPAGTKMTPWKASHYKLNALDRYVPVQILAPEQRNERARILGVK